MNNRDSSVVSRGGKKEKKWKVGWTVEQSWFLGRHRWVPELRRVCQSLAEFSPVLFTSFFSSRFSPPLSDSLFSRSLLMTLEVPVLSVTRSLLDLLSQWRISAPLFSSVLVATLLHKIGEEQPRTTTVEDEEPPGVCLCSRVKLERYERAWLFALPVLFLLGEQSFRCVRDSLSSRRLFTQSTNPLSIQRITIWSNVGTLLSPDKMFKLF